jgi:hypothetical protein
MGMGTLTTMDGVVYTLAPSSSVSRLLGLTLLSITDCCWRRFQTAIIFIILCVLFWFFVFRSLCGYSRRRTSRPMTTVPMTQSPYQPYQAQPYQSQPYSTQYGNQYDNQYGNPGLGNTQYVNNGQYTYAGSGGYQAPQQPPQAYSGHGQNQYYAPPPGEPPKV